MDWTAPYSCRVELVPKTGSWGDGDPVAGILAASIDRDADDDAPLLESAEVELLGSTPEPFTGWARIDAVCTQAGERVREPLGCYRFSVDKAKWVNGGFEVELAGDSVLKPLEEREMGAGAYAPYGTDAAAWCASLMADCGVPGDIVQEDTAPLGENVVFGDDDTALEAVWSVLGKSGLRIRLDGDGTVRIVRTASEPALTIDKSDAHGMRSDVELADGEADYTREYAPDVLPGDLVRFDLPAVGLTGLHRVKTQSLDLSEGLATEEETEAVSE